MSELNRYLEAAARLMLKIRADHAAAFPEQDLPKEQTTGTIIEEDGQRIAVNLTITVLPMGQK